ncbi:MAG: hypothetical protein ACSLFQ_03665 [Thermoanaerobaculia bacterium]
MKPPKSPLQAAASTQEWWSRSAVLYFMAAESPPAAVNIGLTTLPRGRDMRAAIIGRMSAVQSSNHERVELLGVITFADVEYPGREAELRERELHLEFHHLSRFKPGTRGGEWFTAAPELLAKIEEIATRPDALGLPRFVCVPVVARGV